MHELAKAAIAGDESALELFDYKSRANKKSKNLDTKSIFMGSSEALCFLLSGDKGSVFSINENARFNKLLKMDSCISKLLYNQEKSMLIAITSDLMLGQYHIRSDKEARNLLTVKLNGRNQEFDFSWIGSSLLAYVSGENIIR